MPPSKIEKEDSVRVAAEPTDEVGVDNIIRKEISRRFNKMNLVWNVDSNKAAGLALEIGDIREGLP